MSSSEDDEIPDSVVDGAYFAVWSNYQIMGRSTRKEVVHKLLTEKIEDNTSVTHVKEAYCKVTEESKITDEELLELAEKRYGKSLPMDCINLILLMEMNKN